MPLGFKHSDETKAKIRASLNGHAVSLECRAKIGEANKTRVWSTSSKAKISKTNIGNKYTLGYRHTDEAKGRISAAGTGRKHDKETLEILREANKGDKNPSWKGGVTLVYDLIRVSDKFKQWRKSVYERDHYTCQVLGVVGGTLAAHHIVTFSSLMKKHHIETFEEAMSCDELWDISNGITLSYEEHRNVHKVNT